MNPLQHPGKQEHKTEEKKNISKSCSYCGKNGTHLSGINCPAYGKRCGKDNHYASCSRARVPFQVGSREPRDKP